MQGLLPPHDSLDDLHLQWWDSFLEHLCPTLTSKGLWTRLTEGEESDQLPGHIWQKIHVSKEQLTSEEIAIAEAMVQPIKKSIMIEMRQVLIHFLVVARLDLLAEELRFNIAPPWGATTTQHQGKGQLMQHTALPLSPTPTRPITGLSR